MSSILENKKVQEFLDSQDSQSLNWLLSRYCGPHDIILFEKSFGHLNTDQRAFKKEVERRVFNRLLEEELNT